jgi:site-specific DNA recombinase
MSVESKERRIGIYVRVSTSMQVVKDGSLDTQESLLRRVVDQRNALGGERWSLVKVYREEGASAKDTNRPRFQEMLRDISEGKINTVIFTKLDRVSRNVADFLKLTDFFREHGCEFISLHEQFDTTGPMGRLLLVITIALAEFERSVTAERVRTTLAWRADQGLFSGGKQRLGYDLNAADKGVLKLNAKEGVVVRDAFRIYSACGSIRETARQLNAMGHRTKAYTSRRGTRHGSTRFSKSVVQRMLTDGFYVGKLQHRGVWRQARHEPLIDASLFEEVQQLLARNGVVRPRRREHTKHVFLLEGLLRCACGASMTTTWSRGRRGGEYRYYECRRHREDKSCDAGRVGADQIEQLVAERLLNLCEDPVLLEHVVAEANATSSDSVKALDQRVKSFSTTLQDIDVQVRNLVDFLARGEIQWPSRTSSANLSTRSERFNSNSRRQHNLSRTPRKRTWRLTRHQRHWASSRTAIPKRRRNRKNACSNCWWTKSCLRLTR